MGIQVTTGLTFKDINWQSCPLEKLREYKNGTLFLLQRKNGRVDLCELLGNLPEDISWKARREADLKVIRLEKQKGATFFILSNTEA